jgi:hypothetical protein
MLKSIVVIGIGLSFCNLSFAANSHKDESKIVVSDHKATFRSTFLSFLKNPRHALPTSSSASNLNSYSTYNLNETENLLAFGLGLSQKSLSLSSLSPLLPSNVDLAKSMDSTSSTGTNEGTS